MVLPLLLVAQRQGRLCVQAGNAGLRGRLRQRLQLVQRRGTTSGVGELREGLCGRDGDQRQRRRPTQQQRPGRVGGWRVWWLRLRLCVVSVLAVLSLPLHAREEVQLGGLYLEGLALPRGAVERPAARLDLRWSRRQVDVCETAAQLCVQDRFRRWTFIWREAQQRSNGEV